MSDTTRQPDTLEPTLIALISHLHDGVLSPEQFNAAAATPSSPTTVISFSPCTVTGAATAATMAASVEPNTLGFAMHHDPIQLRKAILYSWDEDGRIHITLLRPWDGVRQFPSYPTTVRVEALTKLALGGYTLEEQHKLWIADCTSPEILAAVKDDILCARADAVISRQAERDRDDARERDILEGEFYDPPWEKRLKAKLREKGLLAPKRPSYDRSR